MRAVGESPESAHALGLPVRRIRLAAVRFGGALCGLAGAYLSMVYTPLWVEGMVAGRGWIALALTTFATWRPGRVLLGAYLFGGVTMLQFYLQGEGVEHRRPAAGDAALPGDGRRAGADIAQPGVDSPQHAGVAGQAVHAVARWWVTRRERARVASSTARARSRRRRRVPCARFAAARASSSLWVRTTISMSAVQRARRLAPSGARRPSPAWR